jgi:hypothetical protein
MFSSRGDVSHRRLGLEEFFGRFEISLVCRSATAFQFPPDFRGYPVHVHEQATAFFRFIFDLTVIAKPFKDVLNQHRRQIQFTLDRAVRNWLTAVGMHSLNEHSGNCRDFLVVLWNASALAK